MIVRTSGILLHQIPYSETSKILKVFTQDKGLVSLIAKGASRPKSKFKGHLKPLAQLEFIFNFKGDDTLNILREVSLQKDYAAIQEDLNKQALSNLFLEVFLRHLYGPEPSYPLYDLLSSSLSSLNASHKAPADFPIYLCDFLIQFSGIMGFRPQFKECVHCNTPLNLNKYAFDPSMGSPVCKPCEDLSPLRLPPLASKIFLWLEGLQFQGIYSGRISTYDLRKAEELLLQFLIHHSSRNKPLNSYGFYRKLLNLES